MTNKSKSPKVQSPSPSPPATKRRAAATPKPSTKPELLQNASTGIVQNSVGPDAKPPRHAPLHHGAHKRVEASRVSTVDLKDPRWEVIFNMSLVMLAFYFARIFVNNFERDGKVLDLEFLGWFMGGWRMGLVIALSVASTSFCGVVWLVTALYHSGVACARPMSYLLYAACQATLFIAPVWALRTFAPDYTPLHGISVTTQVLILVMKMHSYFFVQRDLPGPHLSLASLRDFVLFMFFPTLCFPASGHFPRTNRVHWQLFFEMVALTVGCFFLAYILLVHEILPPVYDVVKVGYLKTLVRIALPSCVWFVVFFFGLFHAFFEAVSEIFMFADRHTYGEWWAVRDWAEFWKEWNYRVHQWLVRHVFIGSQMDIKAPKPVAFFLSFIISGILHEYVVYVAFHTVQFWIMGALLFQTLFMMTVRGVFGRVVGNHLVWIGLHIGPSSIMIMIAYSVMGKLSEFKLW